MSWSICQRGCAIVFVTASGAMGGPCRIVEPGKPHTQAPPCTDNFQVGQFFNVNSFHFLRSQWRINVGHSNPWSILSDISCRWSSSCSTVGNGNQLSNATKPWNLPKWRCKRLGKQIRPETTGYVCGVFSCAPHNRVPYFLMKLRKNCGRSRRNPKKLGQQQRGVASKFATTKAWQKMDGLRCAFKIVDIWFIWWCF